MSTIYLGTYIQMLFTLSLDSYLIDNKLPNIRQQVVIFLSSMLIASTFEFMGVYGQLLYLLSCVILNKNLKKEWNETLLYASLSCSLMILYDHLSSFLLLYSQQGLFEQLIIENDLVLTIVLRIILYSFFMTLSALGLKKVQKQGTLDNTVLWLVAGLTMGLYFVLYMIILSASVTGNYLDVIFLNSLFIVVYFVSTLILILMLYFYMKKRSEDEYQKKERENLKIYTSYLENNYNELRQFRHDYQNILTSFESFIEENDFENLKSYYYQSIQSTRRLMQKNDFKLSEISRLHVTEIKSIIASKLLHSQQKGIDTELELKETIDSINMDSVALIRCLGIILDNAIEETVNQDDGFIRMALIKGQKEVAFVVQNSIREKHPKLYQMKESGFSTKGQNRGVGLTNLNELINQFHNVTLETSIEEEYFIQKIEIGEE